MGNLPAALVTLTRLSYCSSRSLLIIIICSLVPVFWRFFFQLLHPLCTKSALPLPPYSSCPSINSLLYQYQGLEPRRGTTGWEVGYTLDRVQIRGRANNGSNLFLIIDLFNYLCFYACFSYGTCTKERRGDASIWTGTHLAARVCVSPA